LRVIERQYQRTDRPDAHPTHERSKIKQVKQALAFMRLSMTLKLRQLDYQAVI
jgi:hypothetical protein